MELALFSATRESTDGRVPIFVNVVDATDAWPSPREMVVRVECPDAISARWVRALAPDILQREPAG